MPLSDKMPFRIARNKKLAFVFRNIDSTGSLLGRSFLFRGNLLLSIHAHEQQQGTAQHQMDQASLKGISPKTVTL
jgi:hypothetical protein